jgi:hypothetical protein
MSMKKKVLIVLSIILITAVARLLLVVVPNVSPVAAVALLGGALLINKRIALFVPILAMFVGDVVLEITYQAGIQPLAGFYDHILMNYLAFIPIVLVGFAIRNKRNFGAVTVGSLGGTAAFFLVSNAGAWMTSTIIPKDLGGLLFAYEIGLPFLPLSTLGNLGFAWALFATYEWYLKKLARTSPANSVIVSE